MPQHPTQSNPQSSYTIVSIEDGIAQLSRLGEFLHVPTRLLPDDIEEGGEVVALTNGTC